MGQYPFRNTTRREEAAMAQQILSTVLITGANAGIGKEIARQLAYKDGVETIYLACRNESKALSAQRDLERLTGKHIFKVVVMDVSDKGSVQATVTHLPAIDGIVMNAGGMGGSSPLKTNREGVTYIFAQNVLGHVVLLEELLRTDRLRKVAIFVGSEAARGVKMMGAKRPSFRTSSVDEFVQVINGDDPKRKKLNTMSIYAEVKYLGALWIGALARKYPALRLLTVSPGGTQGTNAAKDMPPVVSFIMDKIFMPMSGALGIAHPLEKGSQQIVDALYNPALKSGEFYGAADGKTIGPLTPQSLLFTDLASERVQNNAVSAIHQFVSLA
jgi:NAD(P)-dependent dehydrogenase (short-subunit alcohol dehydrogenase family)